MTALLLLLTGLSLAAPSPDEELRKLNRPKPVAAPAPRTTPAPDETRAAELKARAKAAEAERERYADGLEKIYARLVEASTNPEFTTWWKRAHPPYEPILEVADTHWGVAQMYDTGTAAEVQVFQPVFETYVANDDERAFILAHEYMHFLARDSAAKQRDPWPMSASHHCQAYLDWLKVKRPGQHSVWLKKAERVAATMVKSGLSQRERDLERDLALKLACTASGSEDRNAYRAWVVELEKDFKAASREQEALADHWAWKLSEVAGFSPRRGAVVFTRMAEKESPADSARFETHYPASLRAQELKAYRSEKYHWLPPPGLR